MVVFELMVRVMVRPFFPMFEPLISQYTSLLFSLAVTEIFVPTGTLAEVLPQY